MMSLRAQSSWLRQAVSVLVALAFLLAPFHLHDGAVGDTTAATAVVSVNQTGPSPDPQPDGRDHQSNSCSVCVLIKQLALIAGFDVPERIVSAIDRPLAPTQRTPPALNADLFRPPIAVAA